MRERSISSARSRSACSRRACSRSSDWVRWATCRRNWLIQPPPPPQHRHERDDNVKRRRRFNQGGRWMIRMCSGRVEEQLEYGDIAGPLLAQRSTDARHMQHGSRGGRLRI